MSHSLMFKTLAPIATMTTTHEMGSALAGR